MLLTKAPTTLNEFVAVKIRSLMAENGVTQMQLGAALGQSDAYVNRRLRGHVSFDLDELDKIAGLFGKPSSALLPASPDEWPVAHDEPPSAPSPASPRRRSQKRAATPNGGSKSRYVTTPLSPVSHLNYAA